MTDSWEKIAVSIGRESSGSISAQWENGTLLAFLDAAERLNSLDIAMHRGLAALLDYAAADEAVRAVVISGRGRAFCAGQDLRSVCADAEGGADLATPSQLLREWYGPLVLKIREAPFPVIAAVNGIAAGGGCNLALGCDFVIAARSARFLQGFTKVGLVPDCGGTWYLPRLVGDARARAMMLLDEPIDAERAERIGLIYKCVEDGELMEAAREVAAKLAKSPRALVARIKQAQYASWKNELAQQLWLECELQRKAEIEPAFREGVAAFKERRKPVSR